MPHHLPLSERTAGRWLGILPAFGVGQSFLTGKHGPCPICGGRDRFRFDDKEGRGTWFCSKCGAGTGIDLVMRKLNVEFKEAAKEINAVIGITPAIAAKPKPERTDKQNRDAMNRLWREGQPLASTDPAGMYLARRCGLTGYPPCLRYVPRARYQAEPVSWHPCMIGMVVGPDGKASNLHRTFLTADGRKAEVDAPRRMMPGSVAKGSAVRLAEHGDELGIAEGIETAFSATALTGVPCWAALNAAMLMQWAPPEGVRRVVIFGDADESYVGQSAAYALAKTLSSRCEVEVRIPSQIGEDWNDVHQRSVPSLCAA